MADADVRSKLEQQATVNGHRAGLILVGAGSVGAGRAVILFACACMVGAGVVLFASSRRFARSAVIQGVPPLVAIVAMLALP